MTTIRTYWKLLLLSCACTIIGSAFSEIIIAILLRKLFPDEVRSVLSPLDIVQKFGHEVLSTPIFMILTTLTGFILLAVSLRKYLQKMYVATIAWGTLIGIYLSLVRFIAMTKFIGEIFTYVLPIEWDVDSLNFIFFIFVIPLAMLVLIVIISKASAQNKQANIIQATP